MYSESINGFRARVLSVVLGSSQPPLLCGWSSKGGIDEDHILLFSMDICRKGEEKREGPFLTCESFCTHGFDHIPYWKGGMCSWSHHHSYMQMNLSVKSLCLSDKKLHQVKSQSLTFSSATVNVVGQPRHSC